MIKHRQPGPNRLALAFFCSLMLLACSLAALDLPVGAAQRPAPAPLAPLEPTHTPTPTKPPTATPTPKPPTPTPKPPTPTPTRRPAPTPTRTPTPTPSATGTVTPTPTLEAATPTQTPDLSPTPQATASPTAVPVAVPGSDAGGGVFDTLFRLPLPGGFLLSGGLLGLLFAFWLRRRQRQPATEDAAPAPAAQAETAAPAEAAEQVETAAPAAAPEEATAWQPPSMPSAPAASVTPVLVPDSASAPAPAENDDVDTLFLLAAARLAPEGVALEKLLEDAPTEAALAGASPSDEAPQLPAASPAAEAAEAPELDEVAGMEQAATSEPSAPEGVVLEPEASAAASASLRYMTSKAQTGPTVAAAIEPDFLYRLGEPLGPGTAGTLYYAEHLQTRDPKAIKFISSRYFGPPNARKRFLAHARSLTLLDDPHLARVEEVGMFNNRGYLVRPYLSGGSLAERLETPLTLRATWRYLRPLCKVLDYLHECQVVHLHLAPENVLFDADDQLRVSDVGLVSILMELAEENGAMFLLSPSSAVAPEQQAGEPDWRSDLYSLGVLLYQMLAGRDVIYAHGDLPPRPPFLRALRPNLPIALEEVLARAMAEDPGERYQSAEALALAFYAAVGPASSVSSKPQETGD